MHTAFSNTASWSTSSSRKNSRAIDALTIKDVIYGEIEDSVAKVEDIEDLLSINQVEFRVLSAEDVLGKATELGKLDRPAEARARRLARQRHADAHGRARQGLRRHPRERAGAGPGHLPPQRLLDQPFRRHLRVRRSRHDDGDLQPGGARLPPLAAVAGELSRRSTTPTGSSRSSPTSGRIELPRASWLETSGYLEHRAEMAIRALIRDNDPDRDLSKADKVWLQTWIHGHADLINRDGIFPFLNAAKREIAQLGHIKIDEVFPQQRFLIVRGKPDHPDAWLTNRLISDFVPSDFVSRYVFNKQGFYKDYEAIPRRWRAMLWTF